MNTLHPIIHSVTERIRQRSHASRSAYLARIHSAAAQGKTQRSQLGCTNLAHGFAAMDKAVKIELAQEAMPNLAIVSAYNDMLSAHQPFAAFPAWLKEAAWQHGASAQFAGGVPAMCDGITQGQSGMELSL